MSSRAQGPWAFGPIGPWTAQTHEPAGPWPMNRKPIAHHCFPSPGAPLEAYRCRHAEVLLEAVVETAHQPLGQDRKCNNTSHEYAPTLLGESVSSSVWQCLHVFVDWPMVPQRAHPVPRFPLAINLGLYYTQGAPHPLSLSSPLAPIKPFLCTRCCHRGLRVDPVGLELARPPSPSQCHSLCQCFSQTCGPKVLPTSLTILGQGSCQFPLGGPISPHFLLYNNKLNRYPAPRRGGRVPVTNLKNA